MLQSNLPPKESTATEVETKEKRKPEDNKDKNRK